MNSRFKRNGILLLLAMSIFLNYYYAGVIREFKYRENTLLEMEMQNMHYTLLNFGIMLEDDDISLEDVRLFEVQLLETTNRLSFLVSRSYQVEEPLYMHKFKDFIYSDVRAVVSSERLSQEDRREKLNRFKALVEETATAFDVKSGSKNEIEASFSEFNSILKKYKVIR
ncbi:MAG: hypothetical protein SCK29_05495 [Bacillota bacterium]|nr:hypothetical protein [Bacillota bacterium]MDW7683558.1 hypothetical protein [Bacillota bacterium]